MPGGGRRDGRERPRGRPRGRWSCADNGPGPARGARRLPALRDHEGPGHGPRPRHRAADRARARRRDRAPRASPGEGATFTVSLPVERPDAGRGRGSMSVKGRIVVIDDEVNAAAALETLLQGGRLRGRPRARRARGAAAAREGRAGRRAHRPAHAGHGRHRAAGQDQGDPARDHGHPDDRLRHGEDRGQGHEARGRGLPRQADRRRGARGRPAEGPRAQGPAGGDAARCASGSSTSTASTTWSARARRCSSVFKTIRQVAPSSRLGAAPRRERHRQGARRAGAAPEQPAPQQALRHGGLRRAARDAARERALRPREGLVHRRRRHPRRPLRGGGRRHPLPRRDRRHLAHRAGEAAALPRGARVRARRAATRPSRWTCASWPPPTATSRRSWRRAPSARTSTTG